jgi:glycosyltransferase involved in cell wall biosynthesis
MPQLAPSHNTTPPAPSWNRPRLLLLTSHAIQYQAPFFRAMAEDPRFDIHVAICSEQGAKTYKDQGFGQEVKWDVPLLQGYDFEVMRNFSIAPNPSRFWGLINPGIIKKVWSGKYDILLLHSWSSATVWMAIVAASLRGMPMVLKPEASIYSPTASWKAGLKRLILGNLFRRMKGILASGRYGTEFFRHYGVPAEKLVVAPYAVNNEFFIGKARALRPQRAELRRQLSVAEDVPLIVFVGKLYPGKRPSDLLQAFAAIRKKSRASLMFVGDGESRSELEQWATREGLADVHFVGFQNQTELPRFLAAADIFVLPSALETWGLVLNEAMCFSLPVVVTDRVGAGGDLVKPDRNGFLYPVGDVDQLAKHLALLVENPALRKKMGDESLQIIQKWSYREGLEAIAEVLHRLIPAAPFPK